MKNRRWRWSSVQTIGTGALLALVSIGCSGVALNERDPSVAYRGLPDSVLNSQRPSAVARGEADAAGVSRRGTGGAEVLGRALVADPADEDLRLAAAEWSVKEARGLEKSSPAAAVGHYLAAAEGAFEVAIGKRTSPHAELLTAIYNHSCARVALLLHRSTADSWDGVSFDGPGGTYVVTMQREGAGVVSPGICDEILASESLDVRGFAHRAMREGVGAALVGHVIPSPERLAENPNMVRRGYGMALNMTLEFSAGGNVRMAFRDAMDVTTAQLGGREVSLAADFTAPLARLMQQAETTTGVVGMLRPEKFKASPGIYLAGPHRPDRIPVVLVHGLASHPATWSETYNELITDPEIRANYQFWFALYTTAEPVAHNAARIREWLKEMHERYDPGDRNPNFDNMVFIGHSMGGLMTSFQIREGGDRIWDKLFTEALDDSEIPEETRGRIRNLIYFEPDNHIRRAVFVATPHLGAPMADNWLGRFGSWLIRLPVDLLTLDFDLRQPEVLVLASDLGKALVGQPITGIDALSEDSEGLKILHELPISPVVTYHSIIGNRGKKGDLEQSSDGLVPYRSSHLEGAASEKIVPSDHSAHRHPEGIAELRRILLLHLRESGR